MGRGAKAEAVETNDLKTPVVKTRRPRKGDQSAGPIRSLAIVAFYTAVFSYVVKTFTTDKQGLMFHPSYNYLVSPTMVYITPMLYVVAVLVASRMMKNMPSQSAFLKKYVQPVYNLTQIVVCSYMVWGLLPQVDIAGGNPFGLHTERNASIEWFVLVHYLTKYLDWCDTFMMILAKNFHQVSFLQVFHHATIGMVWGFLLSVGWGSGTASYGAFINSVTHVLMYTHYLWTSFGFKNPLKKFLTTFQIAQFASCIIHAVLVLIAETTYPLQLGYIQAMYHPIMIFLFGTQLSWAPYWLTGAEVEQKKQE